MQGLRQSHGEVCPWNFWIPGQVEVSVWEAAGTAEVPPPLPPQSGTTGGRRSLGPCNGCTEGTLTIRNRAFGPCTSPGTGSLQSHRDLLLTKQSSFGGAHKAIRAGADLHMQEQGT